MHKDSYLHLIIHPALTSVKLEADADADADAHADDAPILRCFGVGPHENCWPSLVMGQSYLAATPVHIVGMRTFYLTATRWKLKVGSFCMRL